MQIQKGVTIPEIVQNQMMAQTKVTTGFEFLHDVGPDISWDPGSLAIDYTPSRIEFDPQPVSYTHIDVYKRQAAARYLKETGMCLEEFYIEESLYG